MPLIITPLGMIECPLTNRERDILNCLASGLRQKEIAFTLAISQETVKKHLRNAYKKLDAHNKVQALRKAGFI